MIFLLLFILNPFFCILGLIVSSRFTTVGPIIRESTLQILLAGLIPVFNYYVLWIGITVTYEYYKLKGTHFDER